MVINNNGSVRLQALGFTEHEARAYLALLGAASLNGYEVAKASGIPRANVYPVLERLAGRHAARRIDTAKGTRYAAIPPERLLERLEESHRESLVAARDALAGIEVAPCEAPAFNLRDRAEFLDSARELLAGTRAELLVAIQPAEAAALAPDIAAARDRGVAITTLCMEACESACGGCAGDIHRFCLAPDNGVRWLVLVADGAGAIAGEMRGGAARAIATEQPLIVALAAAYIRQSLALATLAGALGERFDGLLSVSARKLLDDLHPEGGFLAWLDRVTGGKPAWVRAHSRGNIDN